MANFFTLPYETRTLVQTSTGEPCGEEEAGAQEGVANSHRIMRSMRYVGVTERPNVPVLKADKLLP
jgi:hypothetical protein